MSALRTPRRYSRIAGMRTPSSKWVRAWQFIEPAAMPPTSDQCAVEEVNPTRWPWTNIGFTKWMSLQCVLAT